MIRIIILFIFFFSILSNALACTDFRLTAKDGTLLITRSMEFGIDMESNLANSNRNRSYTTTTLDGKPGLAWKAKYGYLYLNALGEDIALDGMNEVGLSFEYLYLPGETEYQTVPSGKNTQALPHTRFGDWVLSNFKTIDEVKAALPRIYVFGQPLAPLNNAVLQGHAAIWDRSGKGIVIEFVHGKAIVSDNIGIMTNSPTYAWQVTNLRNYLNLSPFTPDPSAVNGITYSATGQGAGSVGLPGDTSPPSRFVKTAFMLKNVYPAENAQNLLILAQHMINNVDIPAGLSRTKDASGKVSTDITQWVVFKDLTHKILYYRSYDDMTLRSLMMDKLDFSETAPQFKLPLKTEIPFVIDMTEKLVKH